MYPIWKIGRLEDWKIMPPWPSASASLSQAYHVGHHVQFLGYSMDEEVFISQGQHRPKR